MAVSSRTTSLPPDRWGVSVLVYVDMNGTRVLYVTLCEKTAFCPPCAWHGLHEESGGLGQSLCELKTEPCRAASTARRRQRPWSSSSPHGDGSEDTGCVAHARTMGREGQEGLGLGWTKDLRTSFSLVQRGGTLQSLPHLHSEHTVH